MRRSPWLSTLTTLAMIGTLAAMSGCGADSGAGQPPAVGGSGSAEATSATAGPGSGGPAPAPGPVGGSGAPVPIAKGNVSVQLDASQYRVGAVIHVTVANGTDRPIYTEDFKTDCSIVILQRRDGTAWTDVLGCRLGRPTMTVQIGPALGRTVALDPTGFHLAGGQAFGNGTYRVKFTYRSDPALGGEDPFTAYSAEFAMR
jgi:hypothetical protein